MVAKVHFIYEVVYQWEGKEESAGWCSSLVQAWEHAKWFSDRWKVKCLIRPEAVECPTETGFPTLEKVSKA